MFLRLISNAADTEQKYTKSKKLVKIKREIYMNCK